MGREEQMSTNKQTNKKQNKQSNKHTQKNLQVQEQWNFSLCSSGVTPSVSSPGVGISAEALS
jgi:hypothetical protein